MNLVELREHFWDLMDDPHQTVWDVSQVTRLLNRGVESVARSIEDADSSYFGACQEYEVDAAPTQEIAYELPSDYRRIIMAERVMSAGQDPLPAIWVPFSMRHEGVASQQPRSHYRPVVTTIGRKFVVMYPDQAFTLRLWYAKKLAELDTDDDEPEDIPTDFHEVIALEAARRAYGIARDPFPHEALLQQQLASLMVAIQPRQRQGARYVRFIQD